MNDFILGVIDSEKNYNHWIQDRSYKGKPYRRYSKQIPNIQANPGIHRCIDRCTTIAYPKRRLYDKMF